VVIGWVAEERTRRGASSEFVWHGCSLIWKTQAPKDAKMVIGWRLTKHELKRSDRTASLAWPAIDEMSRCGQCLNPVGRGHAGMDKQAVNTIIDSPQNMLSLPVL
jgi:hypothetical protein